MDALRQHLGLPRFPGEPRRPAPPVPDACDLAGLAIADVGAGLGRVTLQLLRADARRVVAVEPSDAYEGLLRNSEGRILVALGENPQSLFVPGLGHLMARPQSFDDDLLTTAVHDLRVVIHAEHSRHGPGGVARELDPGEGIAHRPIRGHGLEAQGSNRWTRDLIASARKQHGIAGQQKTKPDPDTLTLMGAARECRVSNTTITRLIEAGVLPCQQIVPFAPQEIRRADLESEPVRTALERLRATGRLVLPGGMLTEQGSLFDVNTAKERDQAL